MWEIEPGDREEIAASDAEDYKNFDMSNYNMSTFTPNQTSEGVIAPSAKNYMYRDQFLFGPYKGPRPHDDWEISPTSSASYMPTNQQDYTLGGDRILEEGGDHNQGSSRSWSISDFLPGNLIYQGIGKFLPRQDPRQVALTEFYNKHGGGLRDGLTIQGGLMQGYNPVSGGFLNTITRGKYGEPTNYGLQRAYDKRMGTIENTLKNKYNLDQDAIDAIYAGTYKEDEDTFDTTLIQRLQKLQAMKAAEAAALQGVGGDTEEVITDEKVVTGTNQEGDKGTHRWQQPSQGTTQGTHWSSAHSDLKQEPSGQYQFADYKHGGIVGMLGREGFKTGGRQDRMGGTMEQTAAELREAAPDQFAGGMKISHGGAQGGNQGGNQDGGINIQPDLALNTDLISTSPSVAFQYTPSDWAQIMARLSNQDITSTDDIDFEGQLTGGNNLIDYGIDFTGEGVTGSHLGAGPVRVDIGPNKELRNISLNQDIGNWNIQGNTDLENYNLGVDYNKGPFFVRGNIDNMDNRNIMGGVKWEFGQPEPPINTLSYDDLIYGQNLRHGGLAGLL